MSAVTLVNIVGVLCVISIIEFVFIRSVVIKRQEKKIDRLYNMISDLAVDITLYEQLKKQEQQAIQEKAQRTINKVGKWCK